jgi:hypothetical protein
MHDVRNEEGEYAWMMPRAWIDIQKSMVESQERTVATISQASENYIKMSKLLESLTNATLAINASINGGGGNDKQE